MRPTLTPRTVESSGAMSGSKFGFSKKDPAHLMKILRDTLYSNKVLAVLREYSSNAWDAHVEAGCPDKPIKVVLPTSLDASLRIRDYGLGMSEDDVYEVYTQYGASTKRTSDSVVGFIGIGSKSAFAYSDSFTITSWHSGTKSIYVAVLDETNEGIVTKLHEEPCDPEETGVEIKVPVNPKDVGSFCEEAKCLYPFFRPTPEINLDIQPPDEDRILFAGKHGTVWRPRGRSTWHVGMGCLAYPLDEYQAQVSLTPQLSGVLHCDIGDVSVSASRESLEYSKDTVAGIKRKHRLFLEEIEGYVRGIAESDLSEWERRWRTQGFTPLLSTPSAWGAPQCALYDGSMFVGKDGETSYNRPQHFTLKQLQKQGRRFLKEEAHITVKRSTRLILQDMVLPIYRYPEGPNDRWVVPKPGSSLEDAEKELYTFLRKAGISGIPVARLSEVDVQPPKGRSYDSNPNPKHKSTRFLLDPTKMESTQRSACWTLTAQEPSEEDVFVILHRFEPVNSRSMERMAKDREILLKLFKKDFPPIYGVKTTAKKPVTPEDVEGTEYTVWLKQTMGQILEERPEVVDVLKNLEWHNLYGTLFPYHSGERALEFVSENMGEDHFLTQFFGEVLRGRVAFKPNVPYYILWSELGVLLKGMDLVKDESHSPLKEIALRYPLYNHLNHNRFDALQPQRSSALLWFDYFRMVDASK